MTVEPDVSVSFPSTTVQAGPVARTSARNWSWSMRAGSHAIMVWARSPTVMLVGEYVTGPKVINEASRQAMRQALRNIQTGEYAKQFVAEGQLGYPSMTAYRRLNAAHPVEVTGERLRAMMPWIKKIVDKSKN